MIRTGAARRVPPAIAWVLPLVLAAAIIGCNGHTSPLTQGGGGGGGTGGTLAPGVVTATNPAAGATGVATNTTITVAFSAAMSAASISTSTFTVTGQGNVQVRGTVAYDGVNNIATFTSSGALPANASISAALSTGVTDQSGNALAATYLWTFTTGATGDSTPPQVSATSPDNRAVGVALNTRIAAAFSKPVSAATVSTVTFTASSLSTAIGGTVTYSGNTAIFTPSFPLPAFTVVTAAIGGSVQDLAGNTLKNGAYVWTFTTGGATDGTAPAVRSTDPPDQTSGVALNKLIAVRFSEPMNVATINTSTFTLTTGGLAVAGTVNATGRTATFVPAASLVANASYVATVKTAITDLAGNALPASQSWSFTTGSALDTVAPTVILTAPANSAAGVVLGSAISFSFSKAMDPATINNGTITLTAPGSVAVPGVVAYYASTNVASFTPASPLASNTIYTATVSTGAKDLEGNPLAATITTSFTTGVVPAGVLAPNINSLTGFVAFAGAGLVNANIGGQTMLNGNVGLSPVTTCTGDGLPCTPTDPVINGTLYANDIGSVAATGSIDLQAALTDAKGRTGGTPVTDVSSMTLAPGIYTSASAITLAAGGTLTLDAQGDANAVWIVQAGTALTIKPNARILTINGARAANVFWTAASATLGSGVNFQGTVMASGAIAVGAGAVVSGRLFSSTGQLNLTADTLSLP